MTLARAALAYAAEGVAVFALCPRGKVPAIPKREGGRGFYDATTDVRVICEWWQRWPNANIGTPTGQQFDVLDVDPRHGGDESLTALVREFGPLPRTDETTTGGGGRHLYFVADPRLRCSEGKLGPGLDVRAAGGYVVAPPSVHPSGRPYRWVAPRAPLAPWPSSLVSGLLPKPSPSAPCAAARIAAPGASAYGAAVLRRACESVAAAVEGIRHVTLRKRARTVAGFVASGEIELSVALSCLMSAADSAGLPQREAEAVVAWAFDRGMQDPLAAPGSARR